MTTPANRNLLRATFISGLGSSLSLMAVPWVIYEASGGLMLVSVFFVAAQLLTIVLLPWFGDLVDSRDRKAVAVGVQVAGFAFQCLAVATWLAFRRADLLAGIAALALCTRSLEQVVRLSLGHSLAEANGYRALNRRFEFVRQAVTFSAGIAGAVIFAFGGIVLVLALDCSSSLAAAVLLTRLPAAPIAGGPALCVSSVAVRWREAIALFRRRLDLVPVLVLSTVPTSVAVAMNTIYPMHFLHFLGVSSAAYYYIDVFYALGATVLTFYANRMGPSGATKRWLVVTLGCGLLTTISIAAIPQLAVTYASIAVSGALSAFARIARSNLIMEMLNANEQGRANGFVELAGTGMTMAFIASSGLIADLAGTRAGWSVFIGVYALALLLLLLTALAGAASRSRRILQREAAREK